MLRSIFFAAALALPLHCSFAQTTPDNPAAAKFENEITATVCREMEKEDQKTPFAQLDKAAAQTVFQQVVTRAFEPRQKEAEKLYKSNSIDYSQVMRSVGQRVAGRLAGECPVAVKLFMRMANQPANASMTDTKITEAEKPLLTKIASETCTELTKSNSQKPLAQIPKAERQALMQQAMQQTMKAHATEITNQYGSEIFFDADRLRGFGMKVGLLMASECLQEISAVGAE
ncbi:hypothetical protein J0X19_21420 [Hymenobacter sp. BT186]|uniref:DUF4142 domain-containing protein n=1 Tax=Hymenobacter telluris TaxID=2816474 RepID=A0A939JCT7_9BACT|nr:hypothetical protein [Hymenobacter telluris]MBO0360536.1 hypothetical protein [Hymenobacter telluris]MBW3376563.1 hypothetical protein [Hymenobacter norwichensis]